MWCMLCSVAGFGVVAGLLTVEARARRPVLQFSLVTSFVMLLFWVVVSEAKVSGEGMYLVVNSIRLAALCIGHLVGSEFNCGAAMAGFQCI